MLDVNDDDDQPSASRPVAANLVRNANRLRQNMHPAEPRDLNFKVRYISCYFLHNTTTYTLL